MESRSVATVVVSAPETEPKAVELSGERLTVGRLPELNDIALGPDPEHLVTRAEHCVFEWTAGAWAIVDGGGVNGTFVRRGGDLQRVEGRRPLRDGDVVCILASVSHQGIASTSSSPSSRRRTRRRRGPSPSGRRRTNASTTRQTRLASFSSSAESGRSCTSGLRRTSSSPTWPSAHPRRLARSSR